MTTAPPPVRPGGKPPLNARPAAPRRSLWKANPVARYTHWLHTMWPAGGVEKLPAANPDGTTNVPGLTIVGDLTGIPLLKLSANAGVNAVRRIAGELEGEGDPADDVLDVAIVGGGTSGFAAAKEAQKLGLRYAVFEASEPFSTIVNFPKGKHIYTYPTETPIEGDLVLHEKSGVKEGLIEDLREQTLDEGVKWVVGRVEKVERKGGLLEVVLPKPAETPEGVNLNGTGFVTRTARVKARRVIVGIGRSGNYRKLGVPGEQLDKVYNRLHDPADYCRQDVLVVGGGDSALETAIALAECGADVSLSYRKREFSRPKPENQEKIERLSGGSPDPDGEQIETSSDRQSVNHGAWMDDTGDGMTGRRGGKPKADAMGRGRITLMLGSQVKAIREGEVDVELDGGEVRTIKNDSVFAMIGREPPLDFFRKSGVRIRNERTAAFWLTLAAFLLLCVWMYHWKKAGVTITGVESVDYYLDVGARWQDLGWFPLDVPGRLVAWFGDAWGRKSNLLGTLAWALGQPGFYYSFIYCACVVGFGIDRVRRKPTPYIKKQVTVLAVVQVIPLFVLPYLVLPWAGANGWFAHGHSPLAGLADQFFEPYDGGAGYDRAYWRSFGFVLAWPLFFYNVFTETPMWGWLAVSVLQTFVAIPAMIYFWGKGAYCGWICSCGALAETLGDRHREKMPHGPFWNRFNMVGQVFLAFAFALLGLRIAGWVWPGSWAAGVFQYLFHDLPVLNYTWFVDLVWAGILGVGMYFWFSGRVWCRFGCPLAALMHVYARFSRFRILPDKSKCISCNVCTSVCHQGIDVMSFANKGRPMADPQCVRCSACVQSCPTGVLSFGQVDRATGDVISRDPAWLAASPVRMREMHQVTVRGKAV